MPPGLTMVPSSSLCWPGGTRPLPSPLPSTEASSLPVSGLVVSVAQCAQPKSSFTLPSRAGVLISLKHTKAAADSHTENRRPVYKRRHIRAGREHGVRNRPITWSLAFSIHKNGIEHTVFYIMALTKRSLYTNVPFKQKCSTENQETFGIPFMICL